MDKSKYYRKDFIPVRSRVFGTAGPKRGQLPNYEKIALLSGLQLKTLINDYESRRDDNDMFSDHYELSHACKLAKDFPETYKQTLIQTLEKGCESPLDEWSYNVPAHMNAIKILNHFIPRYCRARYSTLGQGDTLDWHIDTDTSVSCRLTIMLAGKSEWQWQRRGEVDELIMKEGEIWFTNTGWPHRVTSIGSKARLAILLTTHFDHIKKYFI